MWKPSASFDVLRKRAEFLSRIRTFFASRNVLEVETPLLSRATVTDPYIQSISAFDDDKYYLQTSPEYAMKRLLAAGSGCIFQLSKAFRQGEKGRLHHPEFTMLEWYRIGFDHYRLMDEVNELFKVVFELPNADRASVAEVFEHYLQINPHAASVDALMECAEKNNFCQGLSLPAEKNTWLDVLFTHGIEPYLGQDRPIFIYDYPASQAALAKIRDETPPVASRFEVYYKGTELANGFHELQNPEEQRKRFIHDLNYRAKHSLEAVPMDESLLAALEAGLPDCAGIAVGIDRLVMLVLGKNKIAEVMALSS